MRTRYLEKIEGSPIVRFVAGAWCALMREGQWENSSVLISGDLQCVYAVENSKVLGCLTFHIADGQAVVNIAYVKPAARGRGVYRAMHNLFIAKAKEQKANTALNISYCRNEAIQSTCKKLGYSPYLIHLKLEL